MKWLVSSKKSDQEIYELQNSEARLVILTVQPRSGSLRITTDEEKRVFLIERKGFLRSRTVLRNEYGVRIGQLSYEGNQSDVGTIDFDNEKFNYSIKKGFHSVLSITKNDEIVASCELPSIPQENADKENQDILILALCWYLFTVVKKQTMEYA